MNQISIRTNKGEYHAGETIYGTIYLWICSPTSGRGIKLKFKGYEKCEWEYPRQVSRTTDEGTTEFEEVKGEAKGDKKFFEAEYQLVEYIDGIPIGSYSYPFQYTLKHDIPGSFHMKGKTNKSDHYNDWGADVKYKVKAKMEVHDSGGKLKASQLLIVRSDLRGELNQPETHKKDGTVRMLCCIPRGVVSLEARLSSNIYEAGKTAKVHVNVQNNSSVDIENFVLKLMQVLHLRGKDDDTHESRRVSLINTVSENKYDGCKSGDAKECDIDLELRSDHGEIQPTTKGDHIECSYHIDIEMQVNWAPDIEIHAPIILAAPNNSMWDQWAPPQWLINCQPVPVDGPCAVPQPLMTSQTFSNVPGYGPPL